MVKPLSQMPSDLRRRIDKIETAIERSARDSIRAAAAEAKATQQDVMRRDAGGDLRLSRVRSGRGAKIGASYKLTPVSPWSATVRATGPVPLIASRIKPHAIPKAGRRRRKMLAIPGIGVRASVQHPGTKGKDTWDRGRKRAAPKVTKIIGRRTDEAVKRAFLTGG